MSERPQGSTTGIFGLFFREAGLFWEQAFQWADQRSRETFQLVDQRSREAVKWAEDQAREDRLLTADDEKRRLEDAIARRAEAEARLLEQVRLAKQAGLDVDAILARVRQG